MSNCCGGGDGCNCVVVAGPGILISGAGTVYDPYVVTLDNEALLGVGSGINLDTDTIPYYTPTSPTYVVFYDTDGIPYYDTGVGGVGILQDTDTIPYLIA